MLSDIEIARASNPRPIEEIAEKLGIGESGLVCYGRHIAKVSADTVGELRKNARRGRLVLVTAVNPTPAGEGKTTTSVGLGDGLARLGLKAAVALREPSLGPVFGVKGGAAGGGWAQAVPMEQLNLHFTGDIHAVTAANNLLSAILDNHIFQGDALGIDPASISWRRAMDMNDRQLRRIECGLGKGNGVPRFDGFDITAASEVMAVLCLADDFPDLKARLGRIVVGRDATGRAVTAAMLRAQGSMAVLLKDAAQPNLVQTLEGTPVFVHGGPFGNIAHGCNSIVATRTALATADWVVTEAGFGADLGAEKFLDIKCRAAGLWPSAVVVVATVRALKYHGGVPKEGLKVPDAEAVRRGMCNLLLHVRNLKRLGLPVIVSLNRFDSDTEEELRAVADGCAAEGVLVNLFTAWADGGEGAVGLAKAVVEAALDTEPRYIYDAAAPIRGKIETIVRDWYGGAGVEYAQAASDEIDRLEAEGFGGLPVCMAKTQYSLTDDAKLYGAPQGFTLRVRGVKLSAGAGFVVALCGRMMTMPGLSDHPAAEQIDIDENGNIVGLF
jgi:formate--tetrahydrofolate ligase